MARRPRVLAIVGPTGTGKSELAVDVARRCDAEIIGADSVQVYRGLDVGSAKPSRELRAEVPHHGVDVVEPDDPMTAGRYATLAREAAREIAARGRPVVICGGTGLYLRAFVGGLIEGAASDPALRALLEACTSEALLDRLRELDPDLARRVHPNNRVRLVRYVEIAQLAAERTSVLHARHGFADRPFDVAWLCLDLPREVLWPRLRARVEAMFAAGWVEEVRRLRAAGHGPGLKSMQAIGYREIGERLDRGEGAGVDELGESIFLATRRYARRQRTWFRAEPQLEWIDARERATALERALHLLGI